MLKNIKIFLNQLSAATDRICSLQEEQQQLREQNELIRERSEKSVEVRAVSQLGSWFLHRVHLRSRAHSLMMTWASECAKISCLMPLHTLTSLPGHLDHLGFPKCTAPPPLGLCTREFLFPLQLLHMHWVLCDAPLVPIGEQRPSSSRVPTALCPSLH